LNREFGKRSWFVEDSSRKRVANPEHFDYLICEYLPKHQGLMWRDNKFGKIK
jgi:hypothetical protein